jgi:hypothetical protein
MERAKGTIRKQRLPKTDSIEELAKFWDTHDLTDFEDDLDEAAEPVFVRATPRCASGATGNSPHLLLTYENVIPERLLRPLIDTVSWPGLALRVESRPPGGPYAGIHWLP